VTCDLQRVRVWEPRGDFQYFLAQIHLVPVGPGSGPGTKGGRAFVSQY